MAYQRVGRQPLILIAIVTLVAAVLFYLFGAYGVIGAGVIGLCATLGIEWRGEELESSLHRVHRSWPKLEPTGGEGGWSWLPKVVEGGYAFALILLGFALAD